MFYCKVMIDELVFVSKNSKNWLAQNQDNVSEWGNISFRGLLFQ